MELGMKMTGEGGQLFFLILILNGSNVEPP